MYDAVRFSLNGTLIKTTAVITRRGIIDFNIIDLNFPRLLFERSIILPTTGSKTADNIFATRISMPTTAMSAPKIDASNSA